MMEGSINIGIIFSIPQKTNCLKLIILKDYGAHSPKVRHPTRCLTIIERKKHILGKKVLIEIRCDFSCIQSDVTK